MGSWGDEGEEAMGYLLGSHFTATENNVVDEKCSSHETRRARVATDIHRLDIDRQHRIAPKRPDLKPAHPSEHPARTALLTNQHLPDPTVQKRGCL